MSKKHKFHASAVKRHCVFLVAVALLFSVICAGAVAALDSNQVDRLNVMLVIDGSGSLPGGTDREGWRYEAIDLFLALLTNDGNNVGAIVFNHETLLHSPIAPISGKAGKVDLSNKIRDAGAKGDTNIGAALLTAVDECIAATQSNGMNSVVLLFSDGRTDVPGGEEAMAASLAAKEEATNKAQGAGIPVYSICLNASSVASPDELQEISDRTSGSFVAVSKAQDLTPAFEAFYSLIFPGSSNEITQTTFPADGKLAFDIQIPTYGAEEVNIILNTSGLQGKTLTAPSGVMSEADIESNTMSGGYYDVIKLVAPEKGLWHVDLSGVPGTDVTINVLYNIDSAVALKTADGRADYGVGETVTFQANLLQQGVAVTDSVVTQEYTAELTLKNMSTGEEQVVSMTPDANGTFVYTMTGSDYCSYTATAKLHYCDLHLGSNEQPVNFGNTAPVANPTLVEQKATVTPISGKSKTVNVADYFSDAQDAQLTYSIVSSQLIQDTVDLNAQTGEMVVNTAKSRSGDVVVQAMDSQGAVAQMTVRFKVTNLTGLIFGTIVAGVIAGIVVLCVVGYAAFNKPWRGEFTVSDLSGYEQRTHGSFRGRVKLDRLLRNSGIVEGVFVSTGYNRMEFRSKRPIYSASGFQTDPKKITLMEGNNTIYADEAHTRGIQVDVTPRH